ncbi:ATP-binding protein [bacterium]|nr:ATP-binding protein [bacterium]
MKDKTLFSTCPDGEFFGRASEIEYICGRAGAALPAPAIFLFGRRWTGKTEVLRRVFRNLFWGQARVVPLYYQFRGGRPGEEFAEDYLKEVLKQYLAFRLRDSRLVRNELTLDKIESLLVDNDLYDLADLAAVHREAKKAGDETAALRNALQAPTAVSARSGIPVYLILDDLDRAVSGAGQNEARLARELMDSLGPSSFVASASARRLIEGGVFNGPAEAIELEGLDEETASSMMMDLCRLYGVGFDAEIVKLGAHRLDGNPMYMRNLVWAASKAGTGLTTLKDFADIYTQELFEGNTGFALKSALGLRGINALRVLHACSIARKPLTSEELSERFRQGESELDSIIRTLSAAGLLEASLGSLKWTGDAAVKDFVYFAYETRVKGRSTEEVRTYLAREVLKEGFNFRSSKIAVNLRDEVSEALKSFNGQKSRKVLFSHQAFAARFQKGAQKAGAVDDGELAFPQVVGCFDSERLEANEAGPPIIVAHGFQNGRYDSGNEVVWMAAVKDSVSPVNIGDVENFLRRSQILRENFRAARVVRWIVSREGFTAEALKRAEAEGVLSSDSVQLKIIRENLESRGKGAGAAEINGIAPVKEFEVVLPSASKAELVAARAVEEIGTEMGFDDAAIGQIKAALVEACINAFEHSRVRTAKVYLKFAASAKRLTIHVQNGGVDFDSLSEAASAPAEAGKLPKKRGWGFELMKGLMDEVRVEKVRGGAKVVLVKYLVRKGDGGNGQEI